jgi:membrane-bound lytic murein transglycosylase A
MNIFTFPALFFAGLAAPLAAQQPAAALEPAPAAACPPCPACPACPPCPAMPAVSTAAAAAEAAKAAEAQPVLAVPADKVPAFADNEFAASLVKAARLNREYLAGLGAAPAYSFAGRKVTTADLLAANDELLNILEGSPDAYAFDLAIREKFDVYQLAGRDSTGTVVFSSYYEPTLEASLHKTKKYKYPIYSKPKDLVTVNLGDFNEKFKGEILTGRLKGDKMEMYLTRDEIDFQGKLGHRAKPIAWFADRADIMDLHTEGSGRLQLPDGRIVKAKFAATNSHKFKGWLTALIEAGALPREGISHERGAQFLKDNPGRVREILSKNKRYVFFKVDTEADPDEGPDGTYGKPLTGWRSVAVDNALVPLGALAFMRTTMPEVSEDGVVAMDGAAPRRRADSRFVFCQDTGGAIKGPGRIDFYAGAGKKARAFAFRLWDPGQLYLLLLKEKKS